MPDNTINIDESDLGPPEPKNNSQDIETVDLTHLAEDFIIIEPEEPPLEIAITSVFKDDEEVIKILDQEDDMQIRFIENQSEKIEDQIEIYESKWRYDFDEKVRSVRKEIEIIDTPAPSINTIEELSSDIRILTKKEEQLLMLLRLLETLKLSPDVKRKIAEEINKLLQRIRRKYQEMIKFLDVEEEKQTSREEELDIKIEDKDKKDLKRGEEIEIGQEDLDKQDTDISIDEADLKAKEADEIVRIDLEDIEVVKEVLPDGSVIMGLKDNEEIKSAYRVEIDSSVLRQIIQFAESEGSYYESAAFLAGRIDKKNRTIIIKKVFIPRKQGDRSGAHVNMSPELWAEVNTAMDKYNQNHPANTVRPIGWFHTHPNLSAFLSSHDWNVHRQFTLPEHIAMVYDPIQKQLNTWHTVAASEEERQILKSLGQEYPLPDGRILKHVSGHYIKGNPDINLLKNLQIVQSNRREI
jgi:proteasome lid subunit RPN8/RPN11